MGPEGGVNLNKVKYFDLEEYVDRIKLNDDVLFHADEIGNDFDHYINELKEYSPYAVLYFLIDSFRKEMESSNLIENHIITPLELNESNVFMDSLNISHKRIKDLHAFVDNSNTNVDYRKTEARVSYVDYNNVEHIYWYGVNQEDIKKFMDSFIKIYKHNSFNTKDMNPFIKAALVHLLFVRIHPFSDGNGRTARMIQNMKLTEGVNKIYGSNLKISPLHMSQSILISKPTYAKRIDDIYFDLEHDCNDEINKFIDFILYMAEDQMRFMSNHLKNIRKSLINIEKMSDGGDSFESQVKLMKIKKL